MFFALDWKFHFLNLIGKPFRDLATFTETNFDLNKLMCHLERAIKEFHSFEAALFEDIEVKKSMIKYSLP